MKIPFKYNRRSLLVRSGTTGMTVFSIAFVVLVYIGVLALAGGLRAAFLAAGDPRVVLTLREGAKGEMESFFGVEKKSLLSSLPGIARGAGGEPLVSGQVFILQLLKRVDGSEGNVSVRGVEPALFEIRPQVRIVDGRRFEPGKGEVIVGSSLVARFPDLKLGSDVVFGRVRFKVVGVFDAEGGGFSSEVWGAAPDIGSAFRRGSGFSSALLRTDSPEEARQLVERIKTDPRLKLKPMLETEYFAEQAQRNSVKFVVLGNVLAFLMAFGACFAAANTMYAQVSARAHEIGTLRALGFPRRTILVSFLLESALLGLFAGVVGALLALPLNLFTAGTLNLVTFSEITFNLRTTPSILLGGVLLALLTGLLGGFPAAWSAARRPVVDLLRER